MSERNTVTLTVRVDPKLKAEARIKALRQGTTLSDLVRQMLEDFLKDCEGEETEPEN